MTNNKILITGGAGFIGFHTAKFLAEQGWNIILLDVINEYYDIRLKYDRLKQLGIERKAVETGKCVQSKVYPTVQFIKSDVADNQSLQGIFQAHKIELIIHLAAQAGVRYSIENPAAYMHSNMTGFFNILETARKNHISKVIYAGSSSVYGNNAKSPFNETECVNQPESFYAATKASNELMAHSYSKIYGINFIGLRFFTVYGPWGRPDMAYYKFARKIDNQETIQIYNKGELFRDFTYIDDVVKSIHLLMQKFLNQKKKPVYSEIFNIGGGQKVRLGRFISILEENMGSEAIKEYVNMQKGDVFETNADASKLAEFIGYKPTVAIEQGLADFVKWYKEYYGDKE